MSASVITLYTILQIQQQNLQCTSMLSLLVPCLLMSVLRHFMANGTSRCSMLLMVN